MLVNYIWATEYKPPLLPERGSRFLILYRRSVEITGKETGRFYVMIRSSRNVHKFAFNLASQTPRPFNAWPQPCHSFRVQAGKEEFQKMPEEERAKLLDKARASVLSDYLLARLKLVDG